MEMIARGGTGGDGRGNGVFAIWYGLLYHW
jgi:hypothetical protein